MSNATTLNIVLLKATISQRTLQVLLLLTFFCIICIIICLLYFFLKRRKRKKPREHFCSSKNDLKSPLLEKNEIPCMHAFHSVKFSHLLFCNSSSELWLAEAGNGFITVKVYPSSYQSVYENELNILNQPSLKHRAVVPFLGAFEYNTKNSLPRYCLTFPHYPEGTLRLYLKSHTLDIFSTLQFSQSLAEGMAFLHSFCPNDMVKPLAVHGSLCSSGIFVSKHMRCVISDFSCGRLSFDGSTMNRICAVKVSDFRYCAPEFLSRKMKDSVEDWRRADLYRLGLILWEIALRCCLFYRTVPVPEAKLPYDDYFENVYEISHDSILSVVCVKKFRPLFPSCWRQMHPVVQLLQETISDLWDEEPDARISAQCVVDRYAQFRSFVEQENRAQTECLQNVISGSIRDSVRSLGTSNFPLPEVDILQGDIADNKNEELELCGMLPYKCNLFTLRNSKTSSSCSTFHVVGNRLKTSSTSTDDESLNTSKILAIFDNLTPDQVYGTIPAEEEGGWNVHTLFEMVKKLKKVSVRQKLSRKSSSLSKFSSVPARLHRSICLHPYKVQRPRSEIHLRTNRQNRCLM